MLHFKKEGIVNSKEGKVEMEPETHEEEMEEVRIDNKREIPWRMVFEGNNRGVDNNKYIMHAKRWDLYMDEIKYLIKGGYYVEV